MVFVVCAEERRCGHWVEETSAAAEAPLLAAAGLDLGAACVAPDPQERSEDYVKKTLLIFRL